METAKDKKKVMVWSDEEIVERYEERFGPIPHLKDQNKYNTLTASLGAALRQLEENGNKNEKEFEKLSRWIGGGRGKKYVLLKQYRHKYLQKKERDIKEVWEKLEIREKWSEVADDFEHVFHYDVQFAKGSELENICDFFHSCVIFNRNSNNIVCIDGFRYRLKTVYFQNDLDKESRGGYTELVDCIFDRYLWALYKNGNLTLDIASEYRRVGKLRTDREILKKYTREMLYEILKRYQELTKIMCAIRAADQTARVWKGEKPDIITAEETGQEDTAEETDQEEIAQTWDMAERYFKLKMPVKDEKAAKRDRTYTIDELEKEWESTNKIIRQLNEKDAKYVIKQFLPDIEEWREMLRYFVDGIAYTRFIERIYFAIERGGVEEFPLKNLYSFADSGNEEEYETWKNKMQPEALFEKVQGEYKEDLEIYRNMAVQTYDGY